MVEEAHTGEGHRYSILVAGLDDVVVANAASSLSYVLYAALVGALDIVAEGKEGIGAKADTRVLSNPSGFLLTRERCGSFGEELLPGAVAKYVVTLVAYIYIYCVVAVGTTDAGDERQGHHLRVLAQPPDVGLLTGQTCAMYAALLASTNAYGLSVLDIADAVALRIF